MISPDVVFALTGDVRRNSRALKQLRALAALGLTTEALTLGPPARAPWLEEGVRLHVIPRPPGSGPRFFARIHRLFRQAAVHTPARIYHASDLYTLPAMHAAARQQGGRLVYDARELYPFVAATAGRPWVRWFWRMVEGRHIHRADAVFTVSDSIAEKLSRMYGVPRPTVLHNVPVNRDVTPSNYLRAQTGASPETVVLLHQGHIQKGRGCALLADAMRDIPGAVLVFLGGGPLKPVLQQQVETTGLHHRIYFLDPVPPDALLPITASADIGITLLEDTCLNHRFALPNKLFEYVMAGLPVLASDLPEIRGVVDTFGVGCLVDPADRTGLVKTLQRMVDDREARARWSAQTRQVFETFNWSTASQRLTRTYQDLLTRSQPS
ncbi:MAG: glycosyltransferase family 4 protein [Rhodothermales bacterium]